MPPYFRIVGPKNSGKTALVEALVAELTRRGRRVGTIKHDAHDFVVDYPGKDSWRHRQAGAVATVICSATQLALMRDAEGAPTVATLVDQYFGHCDLVLVEGYRADDGPAICLQGITVDGPVVAALPQGYGLTSEQVRAVADAVDRG